MVHAMFYYFDQQQYSTHNDQRSVMTWPYSFSLLSWLLLMIQTVGTKFAIAAMNMRPKQAQSYFW